MLYERPIQPDELYHFGVMGMKWGVRRYQNYDGTLINPKKRRKKMSSYKIQEKPLPYKARKKKIKLTDGQKRVTINAVRTVAGILATYGMIKGINAISARNGMAIVSNARRTYMTSPVKKALKLNAGN